MGKKKRKSCSSRAINDDRSHRISSNGGDFIMETGPLSLNKVHKS